MAQKRPDRDEYRILPDEVMREEYLRVKKTQRLLALPMLAALLLLAEAASEIVSELLGGFTASVSGNASGASGIVPVLDFLSRLAAFVGISFVLTEKGDRHLTLTWIDVGVQGVLLVVSLFVSGFIQAGIGAGLLVATVALNLLAHPFILDLEEMRSCPNFPFLPRKHETYISGVYGDRAVKLIERSFNEDKVLSVSGEEFFEGDRKAFEPPKPDPGLNLQQRRQVWRQHDKADTGYTMDNLKNMHFGDPDEGELSGKELERELMRATAPKKAPEPPEEDFFQQAPVVWRTNKDGTTTMERRAPGTLPAGETDSRTVLM